MKKAVALLIAVVFSIGLIALVSAAEVTGTVTGIEGNKITVKDDAGKKVTVQVKDAKDIEVGDIVTMKDGQVTKEENSYSTKRRGGSRGSQRKH